MNVCTSFVFVLPSLFFLLVCVSAGICPVQLAPLTPNSEVATTIATNVGDATPLLFGTGSWNGGWWNSPLKYVQYNFDDVYELESIQLTVHQPINGTSTHQLIDSSGMVVCTFNGWKHTNQVLSYTFPPKVMTRSLDILTTYSVTEVSWSSIKIFATRVCPYTQLAPISANSLIKTTISTNAGDASALLNNTGSWNGGWWGDYTKYVQYKFDKVYELDTITLIVDQRPNGTTAHQLVGSNIQVLYTFNGYTSKGEALTYQFPRGVFTNSLQIRTIQSVSNVAWSNISITAIAPPAPAPKPTVAPTIAPVTCLTALAPAPVGSGIPTTISTNSDPGKALDLLHNTGDGWNGGWYNAPYKYVQYNFDKSYELAMIHLVVNQLPNCTTRHQLYGAGEKLIYTFSGYTEKWQPLDYVFPRGTITNSLKIITTQSCSNAAWFNISIAAWTTCSPTSPPAPTPTPLPTCAPSTNLPTSSGDELLVNAGFERYLLGWIMAPRLVKPTSATAHSGSFSLALPGNSILRQTVYLNQYYPYPIVASAFSKAVDIKGQGQYELSMTVHYVDGSSYNSSVPFSPKVSPTWAHERIYSAHPIPISSVDVAFTFQGFSGTVLVDDFSLIEGIICGSVTCGKGETCSSPNICKVCGGKNCDLDEDCYEDCALWH